MANESQSVFSEYKGNQVLKIAVHKTGEITISGIKYSVDDIDELLTTLKGLNGSVWYYRESPETKASAATAAKLIKLIIKHETPVCLSETPEYDNCKN